MNEEELEKNAEKKADEWIKKSIENISLTYWLSYKLGYIDGATEETREVTRELEEKISVLLSCKNCPENKGGLICAKEYENKCLTQKIEFIKELQQENAELKSIAEFQQSSNMSRHFENKKLKEGLALGSTFNKALNSMNKSLEEERDKYRNMVFDKDEQLTKAKDLLKEFVQHYKAKTIYVENMQDLLEQAEQFLKDSEGK